MELLPPWVVGLAGVASPARPPLAGSRLWVLDHPRPSVGRFDEGNAVTGVDVQQQIAETGGITDELDRQCPRRCGSDEWIATCICEVSHRRGVALVHLARPSKQMYVRWVERFDDHRTVTHRITVCIKAS